MRIKWHTKIVLWKIKPSTRNVHFTARVTSKLKNVSIDGPADGESAFKECRDVECKDCFFNLRYPFWHDHNLAIENCEMTELCRAALWYSENIRIKNVKMHGIKALRECKNVTIDSCDIVSPNSAGRRTE